MRQFKIFSIFIGRYINRHQGLLIVFLLLISLGYFLLPALSKTFMKPTISQGVVGTFTDNDTPIGLTSLLSEGLVKVNSSGRVEPNLVTNWEINKEASEYTFKLKDNLFWSDGSAIVSSDIYFQLPDVEVVSPDDKTLKFILKDSFSPLPSLLTKPILKKGTLIGTGPYFVERIEKSQIFISKVILSPTRVDLPKVIIRFYPNEETALEALNLGEVQSVLGITDKTLASQNSFSVWSQTNYNQLVAIFYNTKDPILSDENLRLALSFASPSIKDEIEAKTSLSPNSWAFNPSVKDFLDNPESAKQYLKKVEKGKEEQITLTTVESLEDVGINIVRHWNDLGLKAVLRVESGIPQNFQVLLIPQNIPSDPDQYSLWHSTQSKTNISKYSSARIDKDLEDGRKTLDEEVRKAKYQDFQRILLDDAPATPLYFPKYNVIYLKKIESDLKKVLELQLPEILTK